MPVNLDGETIAAIATPPGEGGVGVVRVSGSESKDILRNIFRPSKQSPTEPYKARVGWVVDNSGERLDRAIALFMKAPESYTGEDTAELSCHGSPRLLKEVLDLAIKAGARLAGRGEFTKRAFLNGKMDLVQAEAVLDLVGARTRESAMSAARQLAGGLSREMAGIKAELTDLLATIEASIDFPDEIGELPGSDLNKKLKGIAEKVDALLSTADQGRIYREGITVAIVGRPNVGKSSLLNAILKEERAIVTNIPGTTRDTIEESVNIKGVPVCLVDTAGIRRARNRLEKLGVERSRSAISEAELVIHVVDSSRKLTKEDKDFADRIKNRPRVIAMNKSDLGQKASRNEAKKAAGGEAKIVMTSATKGIGIKQLENEIFKLATKGAGNDGRNIFINSRHKECLTKAKDSLLKCKDSLRGGAPADLLSIDIRNAMASIGEITGDEAGDEVISRIFERFCVGK